VEIWVASHATRLSTCQNLKNLGFSLTKEQSKVKWTSSESSLSTFWDFDIALSLTPNQMPVCISHLFRILTEFCGQSFGKLLPYLYEKPLALILFLGCERIISKAKETCKKVVVGYILRHHPSWIRFIEEAKKMGKRASVMRMNSISRAMATLWDVNRIDEKLSPS